MDWQEVRRDAAIAEAEAARFEPYYRRAMECMPEKIFFFEEAFIRAFFPLIQAPGDPEELLRRTLRAAEILRDSPVFRRHAWAVHCKLFRFANPFSMNAGFGSAEKPLDEDAGLYHLILAMSALPLIEEAQKHLGFPRACFEGAAAWIGGTVGIYAAAHNGTPGTTEQQIHWLRNSIDGNLVRIGRFEYMIGEQAEYLPAVFRNRFTGEIRVLARDGAAFRYDGSSPWTGEVDDGAVFTAKLSEDEDGWTGTPIAPTGYALLDRRATLLKTAWVPAREPGTLTPGVHIPGGGKMTLEAARASFLEARDFFMKYFEKRVSMFVCRSWIFDPQLIPAMPESNLAKLMRQVWLFPVPGPKTGGAFFLFGTSPVDWIAAEGKTSLQKTYIELVRSGHTPRVGGMFLPADGLEYFGSDFYRNNQRRNDR